MFDAGMMTCPTLIEPSRILEVVDEVAIVMAAPMIKRYEKMVMEDFMSCLKRD